MNNPHFVAIKDPSSYCIAQKKTVIELFSGQYDDSVRCHVHTSSCEYLISEPDVIKYAPLSFIRTPGQVKNRLILTKFTKKNINTKKMDAIIAARIVDDYRTYCDILVKKKLRK